jgi:hypothetical protein
LRVADADLRGGCALDHVGVVGIALQARAHVAQELLPQRGHLRVTVGPAEQVRANRPQQHGVGACGHLRDLDDGLGKCRLELAELHARAQV